MSEIDLERVKISVENPDRLTEKEQARRYRKIVKDSWRITKERIESNPELITRQIAEVVMSVGLTPKLIPLLNPELHWDADVSRKGYTFVVKPKEGRILDMRGE